MTTVHDDWAIKTINCPGCLLRKPVKVPPQRTADQFCDNCDFPLFWAPEIERLTKADVEPAAVVAEAGPEVGAVEVVEAPEMEACAACGADNIVGVRYCANCSAELHPHREPMSAWLIAALVFWVLVAVAGAVTGIIWMLG